MFKINRTALALFAVAAAAGSSALAADTNPQVLDAGLDGLRGTRLLIAPAPLKEVLATKCSGHGFVSSQFSPLRDRVLLEELGSVHGQIGSKHANDKNRTPHCLEV